MKNPDQIDKQIQRLEQEKADWYQAHKNDPEVWGEPVAGSVAPRARPDSILTVRLSPDLHARLRDVAEFRGTTTSEVARSALAELWQPQVKMNH